MKLRLANVAFVVRCTDTTLLDALRDDFGTAEDDALIVFRFHAIVRPLPKVAEQGLSLGRARIARWTSSVAALTYFRETWVVHRFNERRALVVGPQREEVLAVLSLVVQSAIGEWLDRRGVHRVHASAVDLPGGPVLFLGPSGRGKSSHAHAFFCAGMSVLADDTAFVAPNGSLVPCSLPIKLRYRPEPPISTRLQETARGEQRFVVSVPDAPDALGKPARTFVLLDRADVARARFRTASRGRLFLALLRWMVLGHELPQMWELFLRPSLSDVVAKAGILASRLRLAVALTRKGTLDRLEAKPGSETILAEALDVPLGRAAVSSP